MEFFSHIVSGHLGEVAAAGVVYVTSHTAHIVWRAHRKRCLLCRRPHVTRIHVAKTPTTGEHDNG